MSAFPAGLPGSNAKAPPWIEQGKSRWILNSAGMPSREIRVYNATGGATVVGNVYRVMISGAAATTHNPQIATAASLGGRNHIWVVAREAVANNTWLWATCWGYCEALVEGTVDVTGDDVLVPITGQTYFAKAAGSGATWVAEALEAQTSNSAVLADVFLRGDQAPLDTGAIQYAEVSIGDTALKAIRATPVELVPAPGAGKVLEFLSGIMLFDYTAAYTETDDNLVVRYENTTGVIVSETIEATGFVDATADTFTAIIAKIDPITAKTGCENKALVMHNSGNGELGGGNAANAMRVKVSYRIHATGW